jgi:hypothetical protein
LSIPRDVLQSTLADLRLFASYWNEEIPLRIHARDVSEGGTPEWHPDFAKWLGIDYYGKKSDQRWREHPEPRVKTTRAFRKLRKASPREFEVVYRTAILGIPFAETVRWLNERAERNQKPDRYTEEDALMLLVCGTDKIASWFSA